MLSCVYIYKSCIVYNFYSLSEVLCVHPFYVYFKRTLYAIWFARRIKQRKRRIPLQKAHHQLERTAKLTFAVLMQWITFWEIQW